MVWDGVFAVGVAAVLALVVSAGQGAGGATNGAYLWAVALGALMFWRRSYPRMVLVLTALGLFAYYAVGFPAIGVAVPVAAALYSAAEAGRRASAVLTAVVVFGVSITFRLLDGQDFRYVVLYEAIGHVALMSAAVMLGELVRARRELLRRQSRIAVLTAERVAAESRLALSRELHDSVGHTLTVAAIHANVARQEAYRSPDTAVAALDHVSAAVAQALGELRGTMRRLRNTPSLTGLEVLAGTARAAGFEVRADVESLVLPAEADQAAYRLVQEAFTNVLRHSNGKTIDLHVFRAGDNLQVQIVDDGTSFHGAREHDGTSSHRPKEHDGFSFHREKEHCGLTGMRERIEVLGGRLDVGPVENGWRVEASVPLEDKHG
jgi:signal transduction histidine kinase